MNEPFVALVEEPLRVEDYLTRLPGDSAVPSNTIGAVQWFLGITRGRTEDERQIQKTTDLWYEAHATMAIKEMNRLASDAVSRFELQGIVLVHAIGVVPPGQTSVIVGVAGRHRTPMLDATAWIMENLKRDVPIWKRETFHDGSQDWIHPQ
ncbi:MAG: molybdenum cofactor biosynthesis protein MoaE [Planctomycetota bacterium]